MFRKTKEREQMTLSDNFPDKLTALLCHYRHACMCVYVMLLKVRKKLFVLVSVCVLLVTLKKDIVDTNVMSIHPSVSASFLILIILYTKGQKSHKNR